MYIPTEYTEHNKNVLNMKIEILKEHLERASHITSRVSNKNLSLPVLGAVVISATSQKTTLRATNLDISVEVVVKAKVITEGTIAVPAAVFNQLVTATTDQKITLTSNGHILDFSGSHGTSKLHTLDVSEFPTLPFVKDGEGQVVNMASKDLLTALRAVSFAASSSGIRPELSSVFLKLGAGELVAAATDSFRLAEMRLPVKTKNSTEAVLVPARNTGEIIRILETGDTAELRIGENQITFISGGNFITSRVIDGAFPDYTAIVPKSFSTTTTMLVEDVVKTLRKVSVFTDATGQVEFSVSKSEKKVTLRAANAQVGETLEEVDAVFEGEDMALFFNIKYILDALSVVAADSIVCKFSGPGKPLIISEVPNKGFTYLVMPMNR